MDSDRSAGARPRARPGSRVARLPRGPAGAAAPDHRRDGRAPGARAPRRTHRRGRRSSTSSPPPATRDSPRCRAAASSASSSAAPTPRRSQSTGWSARGTRTPGCACSRRPTRPSRSSRRPGCWTCSGSRPAARSASSPAGRWPTSPASPQPATRCCAGTAGTSASQGLAGSPGVRVLVGAERHDTIDLALRYLGLGTPRAGRRRRPGPDRAGCPCRRARRGRRSSHHRLPPGRQRALRRLRPLRGVHRRRPRRRRVGPRRRGLRPVRRPPRRRRRHLVAGYDAADSWATDAHKTLNVPYDCGLAIVRDRAALRAAMGMHGDYLIYDVAGEPLDKVPEISRRGRAFPVWAVLRSLGRDGVADLVDGFCDHARDLCRRHRGHRGRRGAQRRRLHPGVRGLRRRRPHPRGRRRDARGRDGVDDRLAVARPRRAPGQRQQLVDDAPTTSSASLDALRACISPAR